MSSCLTPHRRADRQCQVLSDSSLNLTPSPRHLPDITIITPVFDTNTDDIIFFTASRGHHADIGGILPGSMPPTSTTIFEEGANVESFKIVNNGIFDKKGLDRYMIEIPASYPGSSGCRNIRDVESDLKAVCFLTIRQTSTYRSNSKSRRTIRGSS